MKARIIAVILLTIAAGSTAAHAELQKTYDRFTKKTVVVIPIELSMRTLTPQPLLTLRAEFPGETPAGPPTLLKLGFTTVSRELQYKSCHDINWLADGEPVEVGPSTYNGAMTPQKTAWELMGIENVPLDALRKLAAAQKVEARLCRTEFALTAAEMANLRELAAMSGPAESATPAPPPTATEQATPTPAPEG